MKPTLILVNTARGPIVNDAALHLALKERWIAGAGLDDIEEEPAKQRDWKPENPLVSLDNVIITPHAAYYSEEAIRTVRDFAAHEVARVLTGKPPLSPVNAAQLAMVQPRHSAWEGDGHEEQGSHTGRARNFPMIMKTERRGGLGCGAASGRRGGRPGSGAPRCARGSR
jgi:D-isomer specific 2-hydroxyacid dehydrogenase-like protein